MKDFDYAPTKMIEDYNKMKEFGKAKLEKTEDSDIIKMSQYRLDSITGEVTKVTNVQGDSKSKIYNMSMEHLLHIEKRFESDLVLIKAFRAECEGLD